MQEAMRSGDIVFKIKAQFSCNPAREEAEYFMVGKPFFRPYLFILCQLSCPNNQNDTMIVYDESDIDHGQNAFVFTTSLFLCEQLLQRHERSLSSLCVSVLEYESRSLNILRLAAENSPEASVSLGLTKRAE